MRARWRVVVAMYRLLRENLIVRWHEHRHEFRLIDAVNLEFERR